MANCEDMEAEERRREFFPMRMISVSWDFMQENDIDPTCVDAGGQKELQEGPL